MGLVSFSDEVANKPIQIKNAKHSIKRLTKSNHLRGQVAEAGDLCLDVFVACNLKLQGGIYYFYVLKSPYIKVVIVLQMQHNEYKVVRSFAVDYLLIQVHAGNQSSWGVCRCDDPAEQRSDEKIANLVPAINQLPDSEPQRLSIMKGLI